MKNIILNAAYRKIGILTTLLIICLRVVSFGQVLKPGSLAYLSFCNGVNGLKLGADISDLPGAKLTFLDGDSNFDADSCLRYALTDTDKLKLPNGLSLDMIGLRIYKNKIVNIYLFFRMNDAYKILGDFVNDYGVFTQKPYEYVDIYNWESRLVNLSLMYQAKTDLGVAVYTSNTLLAKIADDKKTAELKRKAAANPMVTISTSILKQIANAVARQ